MSERYADCRACRGHGSVAVPDAEGLVQYQCAKGHRQRAEQGHPMIVCRECLQSATVLRFECSRCGGTGFSGSAEHYQAAEILKDPNTEHDLKEGRSHVDESQ